MYVSRVGDPAPPAAPSTVQVFEAGAPVPQSYEILGVVSAAGNRGGVRTKARKSIIAGAAALGANAVVGYYYDDEIDSSTAAWAGGLAVRLLPPGTPRPAPAKAVVVIPRVALGGDVAAGRKAAKTDDMARKQARYQLLQKGYYAWLVEEEIPADFPDTLKALPPDALRDLGSPDADLVLGLGLGDKHGVNALLVVGESRQVAVVLFSKSKGEVVLQNAATGKYNEVLIGTGIAESLGHVFVPSARTIRSLGIGLAKAFEPLPDLTAPPAR
jgi:hypothetical protein